MPREVMAETPREVLCKGDRLVSGVIEVDAQCDPNGLRGRSLMMVWVDDASFVPPAMPVVAHDPIWNPRPGPRFK